MDPLLGEAHAVLTAMKQALQQGQPHVFFECDSLMLCNAIHAATDTPLWSIEEQVEAIRVFLNHHQPWCISWIPREAKDDASPSKMGSNFVHFGPHPVR